MGLLMKVRTLPPLRGPPSLRRDGKDSQSVKQLYVYIVGLKHRIAGRPRDKQRTTFEGA